MNATAEESGRVTLILGGIRSGKSDYAEKLAAAASDSVLYVATANDGNDLEMRRRIEAHRARRPAHWGTLECPLHLPSRLEAELRDRSMPEPLVLVDCLSVWIANLILSRPDLDDPYEAGSEEAMAETLDMEAQIEAEALDQVDALLDLIEAQPCRWILVSAECGLGLLPPNPLGRLYADIMGKVNQRLADRADRVMLVVAGRALEIPRETEAHWD